VQAGHKRDKQEAMRQLDEQLMQGIAAQEGIMESGESAGIPEGSFEGTILNADQYRQRW